MRLPLLLTRSVVSIGLLSVSCQSAPQPVPTPASTVAAAPTAEVQPSNRPKPELGTFGFDAAGMQRDVKPGDDFFRYSGGQWMKSEVMPSDRTRWGTFDKLRAKSEDDVKAIIEALATNAAPAGTVERKIGDFYAAFMNVEAIEKAGMAPVKPLMLSIDKAKNHEALVSLWSRADVPSESPIGIGISLDEKNPDRYTVVVGHAGLGLGEREYYLKTDADSQALLAKYQAHIGKVFKLVGEPKPEVAAKQIVAFETEIAKLHWPIAKRRERELTYNAKNRKELESMAPEWPWKDALQTMELGSQDAFVVSELDAMRPLAKLFRATPLPTLKAYSKYHALHGLAAVLPKAVDDEFFDFHDRILNGQPEPKARWKRAVEAVDGALGQAVGKTYVEKRFSSEAKAKISQLVENLRKAYKARIETLPWMTAETKKVAMKKLDAFRVKVGYPDNWRDYSALQVSADNAFQNFVRVSEFRYKNLSLARLGKPADKSEWFMTPQTVNAYYNATWNEIVFPAAILQPPFFDPLADDAVNYGGIGGVIGHEMGHGFDDQGAKSDENGVLRSWWNAQDEASFKKLVDGLVAQYDSYEPLPGLKINGRFTAGENIGDNGGLTVAHEAYKLSLSGKPAPTISGFTGDQRFFHGWAQVWRALIREPRLRNQVMTDPHSPSEFRVNGVVRNVDAWYAAFGVKPGDKLYLPPEQRVKIW
jgi:putative endopeptidase